MRARAALVAIDGRPAPSVPVDVVLPELGAGPRCLLAIGRHRHRAPSPIAPGSERFAFRVHGDRGARRRAGRPGSFAWTARSERALADAAERLGGDGGALVPGLAIGDTAAVPTISTRR